MGAWIGCWYITGDRAWMWKFTMRNSVTFVGRVVISFWAVRYTLDLEVVCVKVGILNVWIGLFQCFLKCWKRVFISSSKSGKTSLKMEHTTLYINHIRGYFFWLLQKWYIETILQFYKIHLSCLTTTVKIYLNMKFVVNHNLTWTIWKDHLWLYHRSTLQQPSASLQETGTVVDLLLISHLLHYI